MKSPKKRERSAKAHQLALDLLDFIDAWTKVRNGEGWNEWDLLVAQEAALGCVLGHIVGHASIYADAGQQQEFIASHLDDIAKLATIISRRYEDDETEPAPVMQ